MTPPLESSTRGQATAAREGVDPQVVAERREAARTLLLHPLLTSHGPRADQLRLVRRHQGELTRMFAEGLGYRLRVEPGAARLFKAGLGRDGTRPLRRRSGASFTPRTYALLCLTVAALTRAKSQLLVDELVQQVRSAAAEAQLDVDLDSLADRRALYAALRTLLELGVLSERDGDLEHWADQRTPSLLDVRRELLSLLVSAPLASARSADDLLDTAALPSAAGGARTAIRRRLVESPVLSAADLPEDQAEWWSRNRNREREWLRDRFGLEVELRAEGALAVDPDDELTDLPFPGRGATRHLALLALEALVDLARDRGTAVPGTAGEWRGIPRASALEAAHGVLERWREGLRRDQREDPASAVEHALLLLASLDLVVPDDGAGQLLVHAAAARYATRATLAEGAATGERSLFDAGPGPDEGDDR